MCMKDGAPEKPAKGKCQESHGQGSTYYNITVGYGYGNGTTADNTSTGYWAASTANSVTLTIA